MSRACVQIDMDITKRLVADGVVLELEGELTLGASEELGRAVDGCLDDGHQRITVNFERVSRVDAAGLGVIAQVSATVGQRGRVLEMDGLDTTLAQILPGSRSEAPQRVHDSSAPHPRDIVWMAWVAIAGVLLVALAALIWL